MTKYLSKSSYMAGLDCKRKLWQLLWDRNSAGPSDGMGKLNIEFGKRFGVLEYLRDKFSDHASQLQSMIDRLWDLELVFKYDYKHWKFGNNSSIKVVLPRLIPNRSDLSYAEQEIQEGGFSNQQKYLIFILSIQPC